MLEKLETEKNNPNTSNLDELTTYEILKIINDEDKKVPLAVSKVIEEIDIIVNDCIKSLKSGGRIIYAGAGTSGRIAVVDAVETVPTYGVKPGLFLPLMAGGKDAFFLALEAVEDDCESGREEIIKNSVNSSDMVIGITASGRTPFVKGILDEAKKMGCRTALICNVEDPLLKDFADTVVSLVSGPEVVTGSTRMKAGTAQKLALNMISTVTMIKMGKTFKNYMVDVMLLNEKLVLRAVRMISEITGINEEKSREYLFNADKKPKLAILMILSGKSKEECKKALEKTEVLNQALNILRG